MLPLGRLTLELSGGEAVRLDDWLERPTGNVAWIDAPECTAGMASVDIVVMVSA